MRIGYDAAFRHDQGTRLMLFVNFKRTRRTSRSKSLSRSQDVSSRALYPLHNLLFIEAIYGKSLKIWFCIFLAMFISNVLDEKSFKKRWKVPVFKGRIPYEQYRFWLLSFKKKSVVFMPETLKLSKTLKSSWDDFNVSDNFNVSSIKTAIDQLL